MANKAHKTTGAPSAAGKREPVTATGNALLTLLYNNGGMYLTEAEAAAAIAAGDATVNMDDVQDDTALVMLTPQGAAKVKPAGKSEFEIDDAVPMPVKASRGGKRGSKYPFDALKVGQSFHVPKTKDNPDPVSALASSLTGARRRYSIPAVDSEGRQIMQDVTVKTYKLDASGKREKDSDGKWIVTGSQVVRKPALKETRDFLVAEADKKDPRGPGARVFRKL